jgi:6-phosphogluconolactonase (cycloisomerase 2 family)
MDEMGMPGAVYVQTNEPENRVIGFRRGSDGALERTGEVSTGGAGDAVPHLTSQGSVTLTRDGRHLLVTNAASDDISVFAVEDDRALRLIQKIPVGSAPKSVAEHDGLLYVLGTGKPAIVGFRLGMDGLEPLVGSERPLSSPEADPAQVGFTRDGRALIVTERGTDSIVVYAVGADGLLGEPKASPSSGPTPYGFAITGSGTLVVTEAFRAERGAAAASSYRTLGDAVTPVTASVGNGRSEICWAVITPDDRFAFTTNFADGAVSRYAIGMDGSLTLEDATAGIAVDDRPGLRDEDLTGDGRFLYAIDADGGRVYGWGVDDDGSLRSIGSWGDVPATVAGLAAS